MSPVWMQCSCGSWVPFETLLAHIYGHGIDEEFERWPDGQLVVYDDTLEPADFFEDEEW